MCRSGSKRFPPRSRQQTSAWRNVRAIEAETDSDFSDDQSESSFFVGQVKSVRRVEAEWLFQAKLGNSARTFEIDSGADETVVPESYYEDKFKLYKTNIHLGGPAQTPLKVVGMQKLPITYQGETIIQKVFLVKNQKNALLGKPAIRAFNLLRRVNRVKTENLPEHRYADRFKGLGDMKREYKIVLRKNAQPFAIKVPRKIPLPLLEPTEKALKKEVELGIITKITDPTDWVAPLVVVPKKG